MLEQRHVDGNALRGVERHETNWRAGREHDFCRGRIDEHIPFGGLVVRLEESAVAQISGNADGAAQDHELAPGTRRSRRAGKYFGEVCERAEREHLHRMRGIQQALEQKVRRAARLERRARAREE